MFSINDKIPKQILLNNNLAKEVLINNQPAMLTKDVDDVTQYCTMQKKYRS